MLEDTCVRFVSTLFTDCHVITSLFFYSSHVLRKLLKVLIVTFKTKC